MAQQFSQSMNQFLPSACVVDLTPPTFAGISGTTPNTDGSITASWALATDVTGPIEYGIYIALGVVSAAALFVSTNLVTISPAGTTSKRIFTLADQSTYLINGVQYTMGVRSKDGVGNIDTNMIVATPTAIASGNLPVVMQAELTQLETIISDAQTVLDSLSGAGGTALVATLETETVLKVDIIESV